ncbi:TraA family conjugative transfer protein [Marinomonas algarum]|uniref:Conjugal transfer protein TraA n=1 Tax=Marinomonas algarum TaxID=2883105 RepID=A0A9X1IP99_9GAMM|nr:TraA family conjugative transfer protein [Marinomonas algarum]MCB5162647.1 conjugal transfer protein TraA [Marinomonas algarum]
MSVFKTAKNVMKSPGAVSLSLMAVSLAFAGDAFAGTDGTEFNEVWETLKGWTTGTLGKIVAGAMILVGIIGGIARQSLMAFAIGIAGGMGLSYAPNIIETIVSSTLEKAPSVIPLASQIANGM